MSADATGGGTPQQPDPPPAAPAGESTDARLTRVETEQAQQGGKLDRILGLLEGSGPVHDAAQRHTEHRLDQSSVIADQVELAVRRVGAHLQPPGAPPAAPAPERPPGTALGARARLQRRLYGADPAEGGK